MAIDKEIKKKITEDWLNHFNQLFAFAQNKLYKIIGPCVIGIELIKLPHSDEYRPHFVIYVLWRDNVKRCLDAPVLMKELYNRKGLQLNIPYEKHTMYFDEAIEYFKKQIPIPLNGDVSLKSLFELIDSQFNDILIKTNPARQAKLLELKFYTALYIGNQEQYQNVLSQIQEAHKNWDMQFFEMWYGNFDKWFQDLQLMIYQRSDFLKHIEVNKQDKKLLKLNSDEIID